MTGLVRDGASFAFARRSTAEPLLAARATTLQSQVSPAARVVDESAEVVGANSETASEAKARALREQKDHRAHSSQERVKVVAATATGVPPPKLELRAADENSTQLKSVLGKQGTTAAQITLSQLERAEKRHVKEQLQKLGLAHEDIRFVVGCRHERIDHILKRGRVRCDDRLQVCRSLVEH